MQPMLNSEHLILAPFKGITTKAYRNAFARHFEGFDQMVAPFVSGVGETRINPSKLQDVTPIAENIAPTVPQFISTNAKEIILLAKTLQDGGYDHMNWNLGCPFSRIAEKYRGCGILPYPNMIEEILSKVYSEISIKLSVKTRLGYKEPNEIFKVLKVFNQYPVHSIILHARTGQQMYRGDTDPDAFSHCLASTSHPMVYNGDIYNHSSYRDLKTRFPKQTMWMLGRGALMNPFLPMEIKGSVLTDDEKRKRLTAFHDELFASAQQAIPHEKKCLGWMKAIWYYMSGVLSNGDEVFEAIKKAKTIDEYVHSIAFAMNQTFSNQQQQESYFRYSIKHI